MLTHTIFVVFLVGLCGVAGAPPRCDFENFDTYKKMQASLVDDLKDEMFTEASLTTEAGEISAVSH